MKSVAIDKASAAVFGRLPDPVLLQIVQAGCDQQTQQGAYQSCKDIRDFCNRYMKSVKVVICSGRSVQAVQEKSSKTMCPRAAYGIETLVVVVRHYNSNEDIDSSSAYQYFDQLVRNTFLSADTKMLDRRAQLAHVTDLYLTSAIWDYMATDKLCLVMSCLISQLPRLRSLHTDFGDVLLSMNASQLQQLTCKGTVTPQCLQTFAQRHPSNNSLQFAVEWPTRASQFQQPLAEFKALRYLCLVHRCTHVFPSSVLTSLAQLSTLELWCCNLMSPHLLTQLRITHLILAFVSVHVPDVQHQQEPAWWPALQSVEVIGPVTETLARALLPLPNPTFSLALPEPLQYEADITPRPQLGYMLVAHIGSVKELTLKGQHMNSALQDMVEKQIHVGNLNGKSWATGSHT